MVDLLPSAAPANMFVSMLTPNPDVDLSRDVKIEFYAPNSPESPSTAIHSRRKLSIPTRSPAKASSGGPGIVFNFEVSQPDGSVSINAYRLHPQTSIPAPAQDCSSMVSFASPFISAAPQLYSLTSNSRSHHPLLHTPPESDAESDLTEETPHKRLKKDKSPPIILRHSGLKKECGACATKKTPYWRDGWDKSVILCNACGIRYQKYRARCSKCNYIPRKEEKLAGDCAHCGGAFI